MECLMKNQKIVGYCRVSTLEQKKKGNGIDIQIREIKKFAEYNNLKLDRIFKDEAVPGIEEARKELDLLRMLCQKGRIKAVIFPSTDRTARSVRLSENLYYELDKANVRIYFADTVLYDHENYMDVMIRQIKEVIAEGNRNAIIERLKKGREERTRKGQLPGGTVPYGYYRKNKQVTIKPYEARIVAKIYSLNRGNWNCQEIADYLNQQGLHRRNGKSWTQRQVWSILQRLPLYTQGIVKYGEGIGKNKKLIIVKDN